MSKATSIMNIKAPSTPKRKRRVSTEQSLTPSLVTPSKHNDIDEAERTNDDDTKACRQLSMPAIDESDYQESPMKRSYFGRNGSSEIASQPNTRQVYALVNKMTGSIGGNGKRSLLLKERFYLYFHIFFISSNTLLICLCSIPQVTGERFMASSLLDPCRKWWN